MSEPLIAMAIDDELEAAQSHATHEGLHESPVTGYLSSAANCLTPLLGLILTPVEAVGANILVNVGREVVKRRADAFAGSLTQASVRLVSRISRGQVQLEERHREYLRSQLPELLVDAQLRAMQARSTVRIKRIAAILVNSVEHLPPPDLTDELMEIAAKLTDNEVLVLRALQEREQNPDPGRGPRGRTAPNPYGMYQISHERPLEVQHLSQAEIYTACVKLQGFGLARLDTDTQWSEEFRAFRLLSKGELFIQMALLHEDPCQS